LDPVVEKFPHALRKRIDDLNDDALAASLLQQFCVEVLDALQDIVPVVKIQAACFERYGPSGMKALANVLAAAAPLFETILDFKRGDIGVSAEHYAHGARTGFAADWTTVNTYLGEEGFAPFVTSDLKGKGHGAFALVQTSNPSGHSVQGLRLADGRTVSHAVADLVAAAGEAHVGRGGYSELGAVVGATKRGDAAALRARMPMQILLVPGYGAQGGGVDDVLPCFNADGRGALITASRSVIYAFQTNDVEWAAAVGRAAREFHMEILNGLGGKTPAALGDSTTRGEGQQT
jgi:orotidine-5'-phosphate decarboxylase